MVQVTTAWRGTRHGQTSGEARLASKVPVVALVLGSLLAGCAASYGTTLPGATSTPAASVPVTTARSPEGSAAAGGTAASCAANDAKVADPTAPHGLFANAVNLSSPAQQKVILRYLLPDPTVCGADVVVPWRTIDRGPGVTPRYDWTQLDRWMRPWEAAGKEVNLIVWGVDEQPRQTPMPATPAYVLAKVDTIRCDRNTPPTPVYWEPGYEDNWKAFVAAVVRHVAGDPHIGYVRFGIGTGGENYVENDLRGTCLVKWDAHGYERDFPAFTAGMLAYEASLHSVKQIMVGINTFRGGDGLPDRVAAVAVRDRFGFGTQGLAAAAIIQAQRGEPCYANWCTLFAEDAGRVPLEVQTYEKTDPAGSGPEGALPPLLRFALSEHAQIMELYPTEWLVADDPTWPGYSQAHVAYKRALAAAAAVVGRAPGR